MKRVFLPILTLFIAGQVFASGGTYCAVDDQNVKLNVNLSNGHIKYPGINYGSTVSFKMKEKAAGILVGFDSYTFSKTREKGSDFPMWWSEGDELKLIAYAEPQEDAEGNPIDAFVTISLKIETKLKGDVTYVGDYVLEQTAYVSGGRQFESSVRGKITCEVE